MNKQTIIVKLSQMDKEKKDKIQDTCFMVFILGLVIIPIVIFIYEFISPVLVHTLLILLFIWFLLGVFLLFALDGVFHPQ